MLAIESNAFASVARASGSSFSNAQHSSHALLAHQPRGCGYLLDQISALIAKVRAAPDAYPGCRPAPAG